MNVLTFLRDIGKDFLVNQMINKEAVKQRLNRDDQGISFTEVLQSAAGLRLCLPEQAARRGAADWRL